MIRRFLLAVCLTLAGVLPASAQFALPDKGTAASDLQSILFSEYLKVIVAADNDFVQSGCAVTAQGSPDMTVAVASGVVFSNGARFAVTGANATIGTADATNPRFDLIVITSAGAIAVRAGTAAAAPKPPAKTANDVVLAVVYVPATDTTISTNQIVDLRIITTNLANEKIRLPAIAVPSAPAADELYLYGRKMAGRMVPKWRSPSGIDTPVQAALWGNAVALYLPNTGTTLGINLGLPWTAGGTVSHPTPATTAPAVVNQMKRTRFANVVTTTNQVLGVGAFASGVQQFWRGNAAGLGGFFFYARFIVELWPAATVRLFCGLSASTTAVVASDTVVNNTVGVWHDTTEAATVLSLVTRDTTTTTKAGITLTGALAAGQAFDFYMFAPPNSSTIYYRLDDINAGTTLVDSSTTTTLPANTAFMGPQCHMSNGTANITVTTTAIGINRIYVESDR